MNKTILLLSGTPTSKNIFLNIAKQEGWLWNLNPKDRIATMLKGLGHAEDKTEERQKFIQDVLQVANRYIDFEREYLKEKIENFLSDESETKTNGEQTFSNFFLIIHGVSNKSVIDWLKDEYGIYQIAITQESLNTNIKLADYELFDDRDDFERQVRQLLFVLGNKSNVKEMV